MKKFIAHILIKLGLKRAPERFMVQEDVVFDDGLTRVVKYRIYDNDIQSIVYEILHGKYTVEKKCTELNAEHNAYLQELNRFIR